MEYPERLILSFEDMVNVDKSLFIALVELLVAKGVFTRTEIAGVLQSVEEPKTSADYIVHTIAEALRQREANLNPTLTIIDGGKTD